MLFKSLLSKPLPLSFRQFSKMESVIKIGVGQMTATADVDHNMDQVKSIIESGKCQGAQVGRLRFLLYYNKGCLGAH